MAVDPSYPNFSGGGSGMDNTDNLVADVVLVHAQADDTSLTAATTTEQADKVYIVQYADTLTSISTAIYGDGTHVAAIQAANPDLIIDASNLHIGAVIKLP